MSLRRALSILITLLSLAFSFGAVASPVNVGGRSIEVPIPSGYCEMGTHPAEQAFVDNARRTVGDSNLIVAIFAACKELEEVRKGKRLALDNFGHILAQTPNGRLAEMKGVSRSEYIKNVSAQVGVMNEAMKSAEARVKKIAPAYRGTESLGLLATDSNGLYVGLLTTLSDDAGRPRLLVGVTALTLVKDLSFGIIIFQAYSKFPDLRGLLAREQAAIANFVRANGN